MKVLVTGSAGFIGAHTARRLLERGDSVVGFDNLNSYYDPELKAARLKWIETTPRAQGATYEFRHADLADPAAVNACFAGHEFDRVINLAAQAGVRYSLEAPETYIQSNLVGFGNLLEACRAAETPHLTYASSSSVYGANERLPSSEHAPADHPLQLYAATKRANELMAHAYSHLFALPTTGLRFFTVYGPWGRPDMALFKFVRAILAGEPIQLYSGGHHVRDFTYVDDIVEGVIGVSDRPAVGNAAWDGMEPDAATSKAPWRVLNIGNSNPVPLLEFVEAVEAAVGKPAKRELLPPQPGDMAATFADVSELEAVTGYRPKTSVREGVKRFVEWYRGFYGV